MRWFAGEAVCIGWWKRCVSAMRRSSLLLILLLVGVLAAFGLLPKAFTSPPTVHADSPGTLSIAVPVPSSDQAQGPVGTNITVIASSFSASTQYQLGYATQDSGSCTAGYKPFSGVTFTTDGSGQGAVTFAWPPSLASVGASYSICAQDPAANLTQSQSTFTVLAAHAPAITTKPVAGPTPGAGTPVIPPSGYYPGSTLGIDGINFLPGSVQLAVYLSSNQIQAPADLANATSLQTVDGQTLTTTGSGQVTATVRLPDSLQSGTYYLYLVSTDSQANALPSLMAAKKVKVTLAPTPAPTATSVPPTATPIITPSPTSKGLSTKRLLAVAGFGGLSVLFFIIGVILLASAAALPRPGQRP